MERVEGEATETVQSDSETEQAANPRPALKIPFVPFIYRLAVTGCLIARLHVEMHRTTGDPGQVAAIILAQALSFFMAVGSFALAIGLCFRWTWAIWTLIVTDALLIWGLVFVWPFASLLFLGEGCLLVPMVCKGKARQIAYAALVGVGAAVVVRIVR